MATYFRGSKDYVGQNLNEKWSDLTKNQNFVETVSSLAGGGGGAIPVETVYPTTDATKVGQKFIYKGNEWKYHSQAELDDLGWGSIVSEGFPAPVVKNYNPFIVNEIVSGSVVLMPANSPTSAFEIPRTRSAFLDYEFAWGGGSLGEIAVNLIGMGRPELLRQVVINAPSFSGVSVVGIRNAAFLTSLEDNGTLISLKMNSSVSSVVIDSLFTQLPPTTKTATIDVAGNPGAATCDPTIATSKGYIVVT